MRNKMSDSHDHYHKFKPSRHHAVLCKNSTFTIIDFLFDTMEYQENKFKK